MIQIAMQQPQVKVEHMDHPTEEIIVLHLIDPDSRIQVSVAFNGPALEMIRGQIMGTGKIAVARSMPGGAVPLG